MNEGTGPDQEPSSEPQPAADAQPESDAGSAVDPGAMADAHPGSDAPGLSDTQPILTSTPPPPAFGAPPPAVPPPAVAPPAVPPPMQAMPPSPPVAWSSTVASPAVKGGRTTLAAAAGIAMLVLGIIGALIGIAIIVFGGVVGNLDLSQFSDTANLGPNAAKLVGGVVVFVGIVILVYSTFYIVGGVGVLRSREWGRVTGIVVGIISGLIWLTGLSGGRGGILFALVLFLVHAYIVVVLAVRWRDRVPAP